MKRSMEYTFCNLDENPIFSCLVSSYHEYMLLYVVVKIRQHHFRVRILSSGKISIINSWTTSMFQHIKAYMKLVIAYPIKDPNHPCDITSFAQTLSQHLLSVGHIFPIFHYTLSFVIISNISPYIPAGSLWYFK